MNLLEKEIRLKDLLEKNIREEKIGTAIAITGSWGVGKTYFWHKFRENYPFKNKYVYVSLFGLESLSDLKTHIYSNIENNHSAIEIPRWIRGLPSILKDTRISQFGLNASAKVFDSLLFNQVKDAIICFDDFERMSNKLDIKDVMGLANQLKVEKNCQVILILDETKTEDKNKEKYAEYKEKLIDETIKITSVEPLIRENAKDIDDQLVDLMVEFSDELEIHNFRFFQKVIKLYRQFLAQLPEQVASSTKEIILVRILQGYLISDFQKLEYTWSDSEYFTEKSRSDWSEIKKSTYDQLHKISYSFVKSDLWLNEFKKWFEQISNPNYLQLKELANSELISENHQILKNKMWDVFERRFNLRINESDFEFIAEIGQECINIDTIFNTSVAYEFIKKYVSDESKSEKFKRDVLKVIDTDVRHFISRRQQETQFVGQESNIFYEYIDQLAKTYQPEKSLKDVISHYLQYNNFRKEEDRKSLKKISFDEWYEYLTIDIYNEKFILDDKETIISCLRKIISIQIDDYILKSMIVKVLNKMGEESEFKRRYMKDIIENHLD